jgi:hypothetical protein
LLWRVIQRIVGAFDARGRLVASAVVSSRTVSAALQERTMTISTLQYRGHELRASSAQVFPRLGDPFATGAKQFSAIVQIDTIPASRALARRYRTPFDATNPLSASDALDLAMQYGRDIVDGKVQARSL